MIGMKWFANKDRKKTQRGQPRKRVVPLWRQRSTLAAFVVVLMAMVSSACVRVVWSKQNGI